ncbi:MAG TPA: amino acid permease [Bacteroidota bacterium]|nr:amino acid permease [Bacteroidota bacterium]
MKLTFLTLIVVVVVGVFFWLFRKKDLLSYFSGGRWWLTWLSIGVITLMDELTSIFYAPSEAFRFIGSYAIAFIAITSLFMRFLSTRMVEIAEILEHHKVKGGGVYSFSYLVLGPTVSFVAVASILVVYVLTASISTVSAVENGLTFVSLPWYGKIVFEFAIIWGIAFLNILGIRENAKVTFGIFFVVGTVLLVLLGSALFEADGSSWKAIGDSFSYSALQVDGLGFFKGFGFVIICISGSILAYSGIESVVQTAGLVRDWHDIRRAYVFLALTIGIFTPLITALVLSSGISPAEHETDLITQFAARLNGVPFGVVVAVIASIALVMAVNTAFVAASELLERVAHRYRFEWFLKTNRRQSLVRLHIVNALLFSTIILVTEGSQEILAQMYALSLVASFTINIGSLLIYRYFTGTKEIRAYHTSRVGTVFIFIILLSCFAYLAISKPYGVGLWSGATVFFLFVGLFIARKRAPERQVIEATDSPLQMVFALADAQGDNLDIYFKRPMEGGSIPDPNVAFVSFYSPRAGIPERVSPNHYRFAQSGQTLFDSITELLYVFKYELPHKKITLHFGWPLSSWIDRIATGVMVFSIMRLPKMFPEFTFVIEYFGKKNA